jgi:BioD-like N-terminal domain of phosphotransacetylase
MKTILLVPTGEGVGLTSACLGLIYALECQGVKAGFLKPFSQENVADTVDRTTALYRHLFNNETVEPIHHATIVKQLSHDESDELLEEAVRLHREIAKKHDLIIVEGLVPNSRDNFASELNATLAKASMLK